MRRLTGAGDRFTCLAMSLTVRLPSWRRRSRIRRSVSSTVACPAHRNHMPERARTEIFVLGRARNVRVGCACDQWRYTTRQGTRTRRRCTVATATRPADAEGREGRREILCQDLAVGLQGVIVIDDTTLGPGLGGVRFKPYASMVHAVTECRRLAAAMTLKNAVAELPFGGAKSVIMADRRGTRPRRADAPLRGVRRRRRRRLPARRGHGHRRDRPGPDQRVGGHGLVRHRGPVALDRDRGGRGHPRRGRAPRPGPGRRPAS